MTDREALTNLVRVLTAVENSRSFQGIWGFLHAHGYQYQGPTWKDELADARTVLSIAGETCDGDGK